MRGHVRGFGSIAHAQELVVNDTLAKGVPTRLPTVR